MRHNLLFISCSFFLPMLTGCVTTGNLKNINSSNSLLIIGAQLHRMDSKGNVYSENYVVTALSVKNLDNQHVYNIGLNFNYAITTLPAGTYCLNNISPYSNVTLDYCGKPFFELKPDKVTNAGYFVFAVDYPDHNYKLTNAFVDPQYLYNHLSKMERESLGRFINEHKKVSEHEQK